MSMTSHRPYMVRALNEWILANNCTPYILVNAFADGVQVPQSSVKDGQIILNISPTAVQGLGISNEGIEFNGRFGGIPTRVYVPTSAILGIYARENSQGMIFETDDPIPEPPSPDVPPSGPKGLSSSSEKGTQASNKGASVRPSLRVVK